MNGTTETLIEEGELEIERSIEQRLFSSINLSFQNCCASILVLLHRRERGLSEISETCLLLDEIGSVAVFDAIVHDASELLSFDHFDSVPLLVDEQPIFLALDDQGVLFRLAHLLIFRHLIVQLLLVCQVRILATRHVLSLLLLLLLLPGNDVEELLAILSLGLPQSAIVVGKLSLTSDVELLQLGFVPLLSGNLSCPILQLRFLEGLLGSDLVECGGAILGTLLLLAHPLDFELFLLLDSLVFPRLGLFSVQN